MAGEKMVNYTAEQVAQIVSMYQEGKAVETIAEAVGKSTRSVVAKLSREGVYVAKATTSAKRRTKVDLIKEIAHTVGLDFAELESLEKGTREALEAQHTAVGAKVA